MMDKARKIFLIRHGEPDIPAGPHRCVSTTDYVLTDAGKLDAAKTTKWLLDNDPDDASIVSSPLTRCRQTAEIIAETLGINDLTIEDDFREIGCGIWENMTFEEVKEKYPEDFEKRGQDIAGFVIPGGENFYQAGERFFLALQGRLSKTTGNLIVVAHAGVIRGMLIHLGMFEPDKLFDIPMPYAGITVMSYEDGKLRLDGPTGFKDESFLDEEEIDRLYKKSGIYEHIIRHMQATAEYQNRLLDQFEKHGITFNRDRLDKAAKLHDICRLEHKHAIAGGKYIALEGYDKIAELISNHHSADSLGIDYGWDAINNRYINLCDADILYYTDKRVKEDRLVSVDERFASSRDKPTTEEGKRMFAAFYARTIAIEEEIRKILGEDFI